jgi:hypothetical protein
MSLGTGDMMRLSGSRIAAAVVLGALALVIVVLLIGRSKVVGLISTEDWVSFKVPADVTPLEADFRETADGVTVCNLGAEPWNEILIQINGLYVAELDSLKNGDCKQMAFSRFEMKSWKRLRGYPGMRVSRIEMLASASQRGYSSRSF